MKEAMSLLDTVRLKETIKLSLVHIFCLIAALSFSMVLLINLNVKVNYGEIILLMVLFFGALLGIYHLVMRLRFNERIVIPVILIVYFISAYYIGTSLKVSPSWDFGVIYDQAKLIATGEVNRFDYLEYFLRYPNNQCCLLLVTMLFKAGAFFNYYDFLTLGLAVNAFVIALSLGILYICMKHIWNKNVALFGLILSLLCTAYFTYVPIFYTDTFSLPLMNLILLGYIYIYRKEEMRKKEMIVTLITAIILGLGFELRATVFILGIAMFIHIFFTQTFTKAILFTIVLTLGFYATMEGYHIYYDQTGLLQYTNEEYDYYNFPYSQWIMMGLKGSGGFSRTDKNYMMSLPDRTTRDEQSRIEISRRLAAYGLDGMLEHLRLKIKKTWGEGDYFTGDLLTRDPLHEGQPIHDFVRDDGVNYGIYRNYTDALAYLVIFLMIVSLLFGFKDETISLISVVQLVVFGIFLFLLIWESKSKYLVNFLPMMHLVAIDGLLRIDDKLDFTKLKKFKALKFFKRGA